MPDSDGTRLTLTLMRPNFKRVQGWVWDLFSTLRSHIYIYMGIHPWQPVAMETVIATHFWTVDQLIGRLRLNAIIAQPTQALPAFILIYWIAWSTVVILIILKRFFNIKILFGRHSLYRSGNFFFFRISLFYGITQHIKITLKK